MNNNLTYVKYLEAIETLTRRDPDLKNIINNYGIPPFWQRTPGFVTLVHIILEQQVSLASAEATLNRLLRTVNPLIPASFIKINNKILRSIGFSRQKIEYTRILASKILDKTILLERLESLDDNSVRKELIKLKGIGIWTVDTYLLISLMRPDIMPYTDLALVKAVQSVKSLKTAPNREQILEIAQAWIPWRSVATRILWHFYLNNH